MNTTSWKTTAIGLLTAVAYQAANGGIDPTSWKNTLVSLGIAALGYLASDRQIKPK